MSKETEVKPPFADDLELRKFLCIHAREWRGLSSYWQFYQALIAAAPQSSQWISVEKDLPPPNKQVIVCRVGKTTDGPFFAVRKNREHRPWQFLDGDTCYVNITHWMPLPLPPQ
ncbi:MAG: hypothetical protein CML01_11415 [Pseudomonas sp.]|nr:hypothetical protein [Pseudomonas sp.]|tara:strand:- start:25784 stop:26125 length:342 start_codon:yes stop_codon:yes gene_type:complete